MGSVVSKGYKFMNWTIVDENINTKNKLKITLNHEIKVLHMKG